MTTHPSWRLLTGAALGALTLNLLDIAERMMLGVSPFDLKGTVIPTMVGAIVGLIISLLITWQQNRALDLRKANEELSRQISERKSVELDLQMHRDNLEEMVTTRTSELTRVNEELILEITERRKVEEALKKGELMYRRLVENSPLGIVCISRDGAITEANQAFLDIFDIPDHAAALTTNVLASGSDWARVFSPGVRQCVASQASGFSEASFVTRVGRNVDLRLHLAPLRHADSDGAEIQIIVDDFTERNLARAELRKSEEKFRSLFESATELIFILDSEGKISQINPAVSRVLRYESDEVTGRPFPELMSPAYREILTEEFPLLSTDSCNLQELEMVRKDQGIIVVDCCCSAVRGPQGEIVSYVLFQRNITERKQAEDKIERQNRFLQAVLESLSHPFYVIDAHSYEVVLANSAARLSFGGKGTTCYELTHGVNSPCGNDNHLCPLDIVRKTGRSTKVEHIHPGKDGTPRNFEVHAHPIVDGDGHVRQVIEYSLEITERRRAEEALRRSEENMRAMIESAPIGIGIAQGWRYGFANQAFAKMFGYADSQEVVGLPMPAFVSDENRGTLTSSSRDILERQTRSRSHEITAVRKDGSTFEATVWMAGIFHEEEPAVLYFVVDTSEERKLRSQLFQAQKMDAIGRLAGGVAHDFNNLLQAIQGYAELVGFGLEKEDPRSAHMQVITSAARKAGELTQSLLAFSRRIERTVKPLDLNREISEVVRLLGRTLPKMVNMQLRLAEDVAIVHADPVGIQQVVMNLCLNARDAMPEGGTLLIETSNRRLGKEYCDIHPGAVQGKHVLLSISDTGCGMTKEVVEQIFEPFFTTKETGKGTGLGLSVVYGIVKGHQGHILCYSEPGVGTDFRIYLPSVESEAEQKLDEELTAPQGGPETILLVDDEEWVRGFGRETLTRFGYTVLVAEDGRKGLELFKQGKDRISLVILDLVMPEMGGWECLQEILRVSPEAKVLVASGHSGFGPADDSLRTKAKGYISKPYDTRLLLGEVRRVLDQP